MPLNWKTYKLVEITDFIGRGISPKYTEESDSIQVINQRCIRDNKIIFKTCRRHDLKRKGISDKKYVNKYDVLVNSTGVGTLGRVAPFKYDIEGTTVDSHVTIVRPKKEFADRFFGYAMVGNQPRIEALGEGSTGQTELSRIRLGEEIKLNIPNSNQEREAIASILSALDDKIELNLKMNKTLEEMAMALYKHWFVDFGPFQNGEFVDSELGKIPKGWEVKSIGDVTTLKYGKALKKTDRIAGAYPVYGSSGNVGTNINYLIEGPALIIGRKGNVGSIYWAEQKSFPIDTVYYVNDLSRNEMRLLFLKILNTDFKNTNSDSVVPGLNRDLAHSELMVWPSADVFENGMNLIDNYYNQKMQNDTENQTLTKLRETLIPKLISGEVRVKDVEQQIAKAI